MDSALTLFCRIFEDNSGAVEVAKSAKSPKMRPKTKHITTKYHHFRDKLLDGSLEVKAISTIDILADIVTKITSEAIHIKMRKPLMGW